MKSTSKLLKSFFDLYREGEKTMIVCAATVSLMRRCRTKHLKIYFYSECVCVCVADHLWSEGCWKFSFLQPVPVDTAEEGVALDLSLADARLTAKPTCRVLSKELYTRRQHKTNIPIRLLLDNTKGLNY